MTREERFDHLYNAHFEVIRRYVWRRNPSLWEDVVSETFLIAWRRLEDVPPDARPWLLAVARNVQLNLRRSARRQEALATRLTESAQLSGGTLGDAEPVGLALSRLSERDREVILLTVWEELDRGEIAQVLGCSKASVSVRLHRARRRLEAALADLADESARLARRSLIGGSDVH